MATAAHGGRFRRKAKPSLTAAGTRIEWVKNGRGSLTAAAARLPLDDKKEAARQMRLRQGWQLNAWAYRDSIGELRYALNFLANCAARMKIYPAAYPAVGESDNPVPLDELDGTVPAQVITACQNAMSALGNGRLAISQVMHTLSTNTSVAGESFLLGQQDPQSGDETWSIRSVGEIQIKDDTYYLREVPADSQGVLGAEKLDPDLTVISRIWTPHPQWRLWADSPMRAIQDDCESLLILRRMIRAAGRSRLAGAGIIGIPDELQIKSPAGDNEDPEADDFLGTLAEAMMTPLDNEGAASAVVPILLRGPGEHLKNIVHITMGQQFAKEDADARAEMVGVIATALDLPKEVIEGVADLNHWSAWQVDDNTFRHHVEPHVILCCDSLTGAFLRPFLEDEGVPEEWVKRLLLWYDPTDLVTHPDQTADAKDLYDRHAISAEALARVAGFSESDMPSPEETVVRMLQNMRTPPPNLVMAAVHQMFPTLTIPPVETAGTIPGVKPTGVDPGDEIPLLPPGPGAAAAPPVAIDNAPPATSTSPADQPEQGAPPSAVTASSAPDTHRLSRKLGDIDRDLRARLQTAANAALLRQLERVGNRLRSKVAKDETLRTRIAQRPNERVAAILGPDIVTAAGVNVDQLLSSDWSGLESQFKQWTQAAQKRALATALKLAGIPATAPAAVQAQAAMDSDRDDAWATLSTALTGLSQHLLYNPDPNTPDGDWGDKNPDTLVPAGTIRAALAVAGGAVADKVTVGETGTVSTGGFVGQVGTGDTITGLLTDVGGETDQWEWNHAGSVLNPFQPHEDLDGIEFAAFDDDALANSTGFPDNAFYFPGDHAGCTCDALPLWSFPGNPADDSSAQGDE